MWYRFRHPKMKFKNKSIVWETCTHSNPFAVTENSCNLAIDQAGTARKFHSSCWIGPAWSENSFILAGPGRNDQKIPFFFLDQAGTVGKFLYTVLVVTAGTDKICPGPTWLENSVILAGPCRLKSLHIGLLRLQVSPICSKEGNTVANAKDFATIWNIFLLFVIQV